MPHPLPPKHPPRSAGVCAFSLTLRITQRDGTIRARRTGQPHPLVPPQPGTAPAGSTATFTGVRPPAGTLGLLDDPGLAYASRPRIARSPQAPGRQPGHPGARSSWPAASGRPGRGPVHPCAVTPDQLHRQGTVPVRQARRTGRQRTTAIQEDPVGGRCGRSLRQRSCINSQLARLYGCWDITRPGPATGRSRSGFPGVADAREPVAAGPGRRRPGGAGLQGRGRRPVQAHPGPARRARGGAGRRPGGVRVCGSVLDAGPDRRAGVGVVRGGVHAGRDGCAAAPDRVERAGPGATGRRAGRGEDCQVAGGDLARSGRRRTWAPGSASRTSPARA